MKKHRIFMIMMLAAGVLLTLGQVNCFAHPSEESRNPSVTKTTESRGIAPGRMKVTFINPGISDPSDPTGGFWLSVSSFMKAAAEQLAIDLEIIYSERDHIRMQQQAREVAARSILPDYLIVVNEKLVSCHT